MDHRPSAGHSPVATIFAAFLLSSATACSGPVAMAPPVESAAEASGPSAAAEPATAEPATAKLAIAEPNTAEPNTAEPNTAEPATVAQPPALPAAELADGWIRLFDGSTLFGWTAASEADWSVEDGAITVRSGTKGLLLTNGQYGDYTLRLEFRADQGTNSGIFLHTPREPEDPARDCYELNIAGLDNPFPTGSLVYRQKVEGDLNRSDWQACEATVEGGRVTVRFDGKTILDYQDPAPLRRGHIGLQFNQGRVAFRNICLKPLGMASLFNGKDLSGWKTYPQMPSRFSVSGDGLLHVVDGRGQLESEQSYGDFLLQLRCRTNAPRLNSGVFFRCIPGEEMLGYECQIHNGFVDGNREQPLDCGTGGIFRRQNARCVVADDGQWFWMTLHVDGARMAAWVNGHQVSDWADTRPADANPRKGLRLEPGTLMIQGHDPTTDIDFADLRIAALPKRTVAAPAAP